MKLIYSENAPEPIGPYSQALVHDGLLYSSGQIGLNPETGELAGDIDSQTRQVLANLSAVLAAAGTSSAKVIKTTIFLTDLNDFALVNSLYGLFFEPHKPARSTVQVAALPKGAKIEIELIAAV